MYAAALFPFYAPWVMWLGWVAALTPPRMQSEVPCPTKPKPTLPSYGPDFDIPHYYLSSEDILNRLYGWNCT